MLENRFNSADVLLEACVDGKVVSLSFEIFGFALQLSRLNFQIIQSFFKFRAFLWINVLFSGKIRKSFKFGRAGFPEVVVRQNLLRYRETPRFQLKLRQLCFVGFESRLDFASLTHQFDPPVTGLRATFNHSAQFPMTLKQLDELTRTTFQQGVLLFSQRLHDVNK